MYCRTKMYTGASGFFWPSTILINQRVYTSYRVFVCIISSEYITFYNYVLRNLDLLDVAKIRKYSFGSIGQNTSTRRHQSLKESLGISKSEYLEILISRPVIIAGQ
jgi:hypothetical protein